MQTYAPVLLAFSQLALMATHARRAAASELEAKAGRISQDLEFLAKAEKEVEFENDLASIIRELIANPSKIGKAKKAILSDMFLPTEFEPNVKEWFPPSMKFMWKIPKVAGLDFLKTVFADFATDKLATMSEDKQAYLKLIYRICVVEPQDKTPYMNKDKWMGFMRERAKKMGPIMELPFSQDNAKLDWKVYGFYHLLPEMPANVTNPKLHRFTKVKLLNTHQVAREHRR